MADSINLFFCYASKIFCYASSSCIFNQVSNLTMTLPLSPSSTQDKANDNTEVLFCFVLPLQVKLKKQGNPPIKNCDQCRVVFLKKIWSSLWSKWRKKLKSGKGFLRPRTFLAIVHMGDKQLKAGDQKSPQNAKRKLQMLLILKVKNHVLVNMENDLYNRDHFTKYIKHIPGSPGIFTTRGFL